MVCSILFSAFINHSMIHLVDGGGVGVVVFSFIISLCTGMF